MQPGRTETFSAVEKEGSEFAVERENDCLVSSASPHGRGDMTDEPVVFSDEGDKISDPLVEKSESCNALKQPVLYEPKANGLHDSESVPDLATNKRSSSMSKELVLSAAKTNSTHDDVLSPVPVDCRLPVLKGHAGSNLPFVGAFTVQCANCFKWRLIPTKEKYEEIREHILAQPFVCDKAQDWRSEISCNDPPDLEQDGKTVWAIDKPSIARPPPGWERELKFRGEGSSKFADVYYIAPSGKRLRSMVEVQMHLLKHPEYGREGVEISQFSFQTPKPSQENYLRKRSHVTTSCSNEGLLPPSPPEPNEGTSLSPDPRHAKKQK